MNLFQSAVKNFENVGIRPNQDSLNAKVLFILIIFWVDNGFNYVYFFREVNTFSEMANSIFITAVSTIISIGVIILIVIAAKIFRLVDYAEKITDRASEISPVSLKMHKLASRQIEKWSTITYFFVTKIVPMGIILPKFILSFFIYYTIEPGEDAFLLPTPTWFPFDWKNPTGYSLAVLIEFTLTTYMSVFVGSLITIGIASFLFEAAIIEDIEMHLNSVDESSKLREHRQETFKKLSNAIEIHSMMKQIMVEFSEVCQPFFTALCSASIVLISVALLWIETELSHHGMDIMVLFSAFAYTCAAYCVMLLACELTQRSSDYFTNIEDIVVQWHWYLFPGEIKRLLPLILLVVQQPVEIECFGGIVCNRELYKKVVNKSYSYFTTLRQFSS